MADQTGDTGNGMGLGGQPQGDAVPQQAQVPQPHQQQTRLPQQQAPRSNTRAQGPEAAKAQKVEIEGLDPKALKELSAALKDLTGFNTKHSASVKDMTAAVQDLGRHLQALNGNGDLGVRRFKTLQDTVCSLVDDLDDVQDQYSTLIRLQRQIQAAPDLLMGKNKTEGLRVLRQMIDATKTLQKSHELDAKTLNQLDKNLKVLEKTYQSVEKAKDDAFDREAVDEITEALREANESAARLKKNFAETSTTGISRGVKRLKNDMGDAFDNPLKTFMEAKGLDKIAAKFKTAFGKDARRDRKETRQRDKQAWDQWRTDRSETAEDRKKLKEYRKSSKEYAKTSLHVPTEVPKVKPKAVRSTKVISGLTPRPTTTPTAKAATPTNTAGAGGPLNFANVTIQSATIEKLAGDLMDKASPKGQLPGGPGVSGGDDADEGDEGRIPRKEKKRGKKGPRKSKRQKAREKAAAKLAESKAAEVPTEAAADAAEAPTSGPRKLKDFIKPRTKFKWRGAGRAASRAAGAGMEAAAGGGVEALAMGGGRVAGAGLMRGLGAGLGRVAGMAAAPLAIAGALLSVRDKIAEENKELNDALAGGGIHSGGVDFVGVRKSLLSSGVSNAASRGIGKKENMEVMQALMAGGQGLGFLAGGDNVNLENALMTRREAEQGRDQFQGGGFVGALSALTRAVTLGGTANASDPNAQRRMRESSGTIGAVMKNANFYGKNVGMDRSQSVKLTMDLLEKYQLTTEQTGDFFLKIDKAMRTAQISSSKYLEIVESVNSGFGEFNNTMKLTSHMLDLVGRNARFTGDRMKNMVGEMVKGPQQDIAHKAFTAMDSFQDEGTKSSAIKMFEDMGKKAMDDLVEQTRDYGEFFGEENGVQKNAQGQIMAVTDMTQFEARLAELTRDGGKLSKDPTVKAIQTQLEKTSSALAYSTAQTKNLKTGNLIGYAATSENFGATPEGAYVDNINLMKTLAKRSGVSLSDLTSRDATVRGEAMQKSSTLQALLAKELGMPMEEMRKKMEAMTGIRSQVMDLISEKAGKISATGEMPSDGSVTGRQYEALADLARSLASQGAEGLAGRNLTNNKDAVAALQKLVKDPKGNKLIRILERNESFLTDLGGSLGVFTDSIDRDKAAANAKAKADEVSTATWTSADIFAASFSYLFDKLVEKLDWLGEVINPGNWFKKKNRLGEYNRPEDKKAATYGSGVRQELSNFLAPMKGKQGELDPEAKTFYGVLETIASKTGALSTEESDSLNKALAGLREYLKKGENAKKFGIKATDLDAASNKVYAAGDLAVQNAGMNAALEAQDARIKAAAAQGQGMRKKATVFQGASLVAATDEILTGEDGNTSRSNQEAFARLRHSDEAKGKSEAQLKQLYGARYMVNNALLQGLSGGDAQKQAESNAVIQERLKEDTMQRYFGKGDKGVYAFQAGSDQDTMMAELLRYAQGKGLLAGATRTVGANGQVVYNITNNNVDATTAPKEQRAPAGKTSETASTTKPPTVPVP